MPPYHKNTPGLVLVFLMTHPKSVWQTDLIKGIGVTERNGIEAIKQLRDEGIISEHWTKQKKFITVKSRIRKGILEGVFLTVLEAKKAGFQSTGDTPLRSTGDTPLNTPSKPLPCNSLTAPLSDLICNLPLIYINIKEPLYSFTVSCLTKKTISSPVVFENLQNVTRDVVEELVSNNFKVSSVLPKEEPQRPDRSCEYNIVKADALSVGIKPYRIKPNADFGAGEWENLVKVSGANCFPVYTGLGIVERIILCAREWVKGFMDTYEHRVHPLSGRVSDPLGRGDMVRSRFWQGIARITIKADALGAEYRRHNQPMFNFYKENPWKLKGTHEKFPDYFSGPFARSLYLKYRGECTKMDALRREEIEKINPEFLPENYEAGDPVKNEYFRRLLENEIKFVAGYNGRTAESQITDFIQKGILPQEFAEGPLNTLCQGYRFVRPLTITERLAGISR